MSVQVMSYAGLTCSKSSELEILPAIPARTGNIKIDEELLSELKRIVMLLRMKLT